MPAFGLIYSTPNLYLSTPTPSPGRWWKAAGGSGARVVLGRGPSRMGSRASVREREAKEEGEEAEADATGRGAQRYA